MEDSKICPACSAKNPAAANFCEQCGTAFSPAGQPAGAPQSAGQPAGAPQSAGQPTDAPQSAGQPTGAPQTAGQPTDAPQSAGQPAGAPQSAGQPTDAPQTAGQPAGAPQQPYYQQPCQQPGYTYGRQPRSYFYGRQPRRRVSQYPLGQVGRPFGLFDGTFTPGSITPVRNRIAAAVLCLLVGPFGIHKFYTGQWGSGAVSLFLLLTLAWTGWIWGILYAVSLAEAILLFTMSDRDFENKYHVRAQ
ncbi:MAG: NINE protein [Oscillospiraceae bacterium]|jgi:hypothetical protein|nr:NINE protein [Oscillospiraceae bacterium]